MLQSGLCDELFIFAEQTNEIKAITNIEAFNFFLGSSRLRFTVEADLEWEEEK